LACDLPNRRTTTLALNFRFFAVAAALALAACNRSDKPPPADVIADVAGVQITASELEREFTLAGVPSDKRGEDQVRAALRDLVTRKYTAGKAHAALLDNDPTVAGDLARTRDQILSAALSRAELKDKAAGIKQVDVDAYIAAHPRQFDKRVVYAVDQIQVPTIADISQYVALTKDAKTLEEIEPKLDAMRAPRTRSRSEIDGGELTDVFAQALAGQVSDAVYFARRAADGVFFKVLAVDPRPVTGKEAQTKAEDAIRNDLLAKILDADAATALGATKFSGDYARIMAATKPAN
jgi:EpsD family peptidyl-prolyl cis-trans isomerase